VVSEPSAEGVEEQARPERPLVLLDHALEDAVVVRLEVGADLLDISRLLVGQRADYSRRVSERPNAE
jgi:hypothetical protein